MTIEQIAADLREHMDRSEQHYREMKELKMEPTSVKNIFETSPMAGMLPYMAGGNWGGAGAGAGAGLGAGLLGGVLGGALLGGNGGLLGNRNGVVGEGFVTPAQLTAALNGVTESNNTTQILQTLGDIKAAVPLAEAQVQLALAGSTAETVRAIGATENLLVQGQTAIQTNLAGVNVNLLQSSAAVKEAVANYGNANLVATNAAAAANALAVANSTKEIIAALNDQNVANLQRQLSVAETALLETRAEGRARASEINITNTNTATAQQIQTQAQSQAQFQILAQLAANLNNLANDVQVVRQGQTIFNSGTMAASGTQTAANTRVS